MKDGYLTEEDPEYKYLKPAWDEFAQLTPPLIKQYVEDMQSAESLSAEEVRSRRKYLTSEEITRLNADRVRLQWRIAVAERIHSLKIRGTAMPLWDELDEPGKSKEMQSVSRSIVPDDWMPPGKLNRRAWALLKVDKRHRTDIETWIMKSKDYLKDREDVAWGSIQRFMRDNLKKMYPDFDGALYATDLDILLKRAIREGKIVISHPGSGESGAR